MLRCCGVEPELKKFQSFEYWFCNECKKEVKEELVPNYTIVRNEEVSTRTGYTGEQQQLEFDWFKQELAELFKGDKV